MQVPTFHSLRPFFAALCILAASVSIRGDDTTTITLPVPAGTVDVETRVGKFVPDEAKKPTVSPDTVEEPAGVTPVTPEKPSENKGETTVTPVSVAKAPEDSVIIVGPLQEIPAGTAFFVTMPAEQKGPDLYVTPSVKTPEGAAPPAVLPGQPGTVVYLFAPAVAGDYRFEAAWQVSLDRADGPDRHGVKAFVVAVKAAQPPPVTPPTVPTTPDTPPVTPTTDKATAATYVYEKDQTAIPSPVLSALNRLNREKHILATVLEADPKDGTGDVPEQYKVPLAAAKKAGLPALVVTAGDKVLSIVNDPKSEQAVLDAVK